MTKEQILEWAKQGRARATELKSEAKDHHRKAYLDGYDDALQALEMLLALSEIREAILKEATRDIREKLQPPVYLLRPDG